MQVQVNTDDNVEGRDARPTRDGASPGAGEAVVRERVGGDDMTANHAARR